MTCPTTTNTTAAAECFNQLAGQATGMATFALLLTVILLSATFLFMMFFVWLQATLYVYTRW